MKLALDSEYRRRWQEYHLKNGMIMDSRVINWRNVEWDKVVTIKTFINNHVHVVKSDNPNFKFFMCFRWGGQKLSNDKDKEGKFKKKYDPIHIWTMGWSDGKNCFLIDIDFFTGNFIKEYTTNIKEFKNHIHPKIKDLVHE